MILGKAIFLASVLLPFAPKGLARGSRAFQQPSPSSMPVEPLCPSDDTSICSPREGVPLAPHLRLVRDPDIESPDASASRRDGSQSSLTTSLKSPDYWTRIDRLKPCSVRGFVSWLRRHEITAKLTWHEFYTLHSEYAEYVNAAPLSERQLQIEAPRYGIKKTRPNIKAASGKRDRPYFYEVRATQKRKRAA